MWARLVEQLAATAASKARTTHAGVDIFFLKKTKKNKRKRAKVDEIRDGREKKKEKEKENKKSVEVL
jgi:uncharacterized protein YdaU (DUF1376 family)